jgi:hypothetical protein
MASIYTDYIAAAILFNLQILPESLMTGALLLGLITANQAILAMAAGGLGTQVLTDVFGKLLLNVMPAGTPDKRHTSSLDTCSSGFVGKTWLRLLTGTTDANIYWHPNVPSIYMATIGYFAGYGYALQQLYKEEIRAGIVSSPLLTATAVLTLILLLIALVFRVASGCESLLGAMGGLAVGVLLGYLGTIALGYTTDRRGTNLWGIPLLRDRINSGAPVYVCDPIEQ